MSQGHDKVNSMDKCQFCGQQRGPEHRAEDVTLFGYVWPVCYCPNMPESWVGMGYPDDDMTVFEVDPEPCR